MNYETKIKKLPKSEVELEITLPAETLEAARKKAVTSFSISLEMPGFRKGHVPENMVVEKVGEDRLLEEAADILVGEHFHKVLAQEKLDIIGRPKISVTKLALGNPVEFKAVFAVMPEFELGDYKKIAKSVSGKFKMDNEEATDKELSDVLLQIRKNKAHFDWHRANPDHKEHEHPDLDKEENLPELDDTFAKEAGSFKNIEELKTKVKENIVEEKKIRNIEKKRAAIMDELVKSTKIDLAEILVDSENKKSLAQMKSDIERMGMKFEDYLKEVKKTEDDLRKELRESSEKKAKVQLIFNKIAVLENLSPNKAVLDNEVKTLMEHYKDVSEEAARIYVGTVLINQEVLKLLEQQ